MHGDTLQPPGLPAGSAPLLHASGLCRRYHAGRRLRSGKGATVRALEDVDLEVRSGEMVAVLGPSGSGKSTLLRLLALFERPDEGEIEVGGIATTSLSTRQRDQLRAGTIALLSEEVRLLSSLTAIENVRLALRWRGSSPEVRGGEAPAPVPAAPAARDLLESAGVPTSLHPRLPSQLSGGEAQRVAIARALAQGARILVADEPTAHLDSTRARAVGALLHALAQDRGLAIVIATHDEAIGALADRRIRLRDGRRVTGAPGQATDPARNPQRGPGPARAACATRPAPARAARETRPAPARAARETRPAPARAARATRPPPRLHARGLRRVHRTGAGPVAAVDGIDLEAAPGEVIAIVGPSGSGKTTLLLLLGGLLRPTAGAVVVDGIALHDKGARELDRLRRGRIAFTFQVPRLIPSLSAVENVLLGQALAGRRPSREESRGLLETLDMLALADRPARDLSAGERQRCSLARALASHPRVLLADEPFGRLGASDREAMLDRLLEAAAGDAAVVLATHDERLAAGANRRLRLRDGRLDAGEDRAAGSDGDGFGS